MARPSRLSFKPPGGRMLARWMAAMAVAAVFAVAPAHADAVADFYRGKQIDLIIGYGPSGGYDVYARLRARHFGKFIPGNPSVVAQNMPGLSLIHISEPTR